MYRNDIWKVCFNLEKRRMIQNDLDNRTMRVISTSIEEERANPAGVEEEEAMVLEMLLAKLPVAKEECFIGSTSGGEKGKRAITC